MKNKVIFLIFLLSILCTGTIFADSWEVGDRCFADWSYDNYWYPGTIIETDGAQYHIQFDDGDREWLSSSSLMEDNLRVGTSVQVNWLMSGGYYTGTISERIGDVVFIEYDDGDEEWTTISAVKFIF